jgi:hypothetical protein
MSEEVGQFFINPVISTNSDFKKLLELEDSYPNQHSSGVIEEDPVTGEIRRGIYQEDYSREEFTKGSRFLFGKPGSGKTKLLAKLEKLYSSEDTPQTDKRVVQHNQKVQLIKLKESYQNNSTENNLTQRVAADASLLLLDGLDEMNEQFIYKFLEDVNNLTINRAELRIIISSRTYLLERYPEFKSLKNFKYSVIRPFNRELQKEFIEKTNLELTQKESLKDYLWQRETSLYFNPRYLSILCFLVKERIIEESEIINLSRYDIFEKLTKFALEREIEEKSQPEIYLNVLQKLATVISIKGDTEINSEDLMDFFDYAQFDSKAVVLNKDSLKTLYDKCLLKKGKNALFDYIEFDDREIQEFLTAKELIKISKHVNFFTKLCFTENPICFKSHWLNSLNFFIEKKPETFLQFLKYCHRLDDISQINSAFHSVFEYLSIERLSGKDKEAIFTIIFEYYQEKTMWTLGPYWKLKSKLFTLYNHENEKHKELVFQYILNSFLNSTDSLSNTEKYNYIGLTNALSVIQASFDKLSENEKNILKGLLIKDINIALNNEDDGQILLQKRLELLGKYKDKKIFTNENIKSLFKTRQIEATQEQAGKKSHIPLEDISLKRLLELGYQSDEENDLFFNLLMRNHNSKYTHESNSNTVIFQMDYLTEKVNSKKNIKKILDKISLESYKAECFICDSYFNLGEKQCRSFSEKIYQLLIKPKEVEEYLRRLLYSEKSRSSWICDLKNHLLERVLEENRNWLDEEILLLHSSQEDSKNKLELLFFNTERINLVLDKLNSNTTGVSRNSCSIKVILEIFKDDTNYLSRLIEFLIKSNNPNKENIAKEISSKAGLSVQKNKNMSETLITGNRAVIAEKLQNKDPQLTANQNEYNKILQLSLSDLSKKYLNSYNRDKDLCAKAIQERYPSLTEKLETEIKKQSKEQHETLCNNSGNPADLYFKINYLINIYDSESLSKFLKDLILKYSEDLEYYTSIISDLDLRLKDEKFLTDLLKKFSKVPENNGTKATITTLKISRYADLKLAKERLKNILEKKAKHCVLAMHSMEEHREALSSFPDQELFFGKDKAFKEILKLCKNSLEESPSEYGRMSLLFSMLCNNLKILSAKPELEERSRELLNELESEFKKLGSFPNKNFLELTLSELRAYFTNLAKPPSILEASLRYNSLRDSILTDIPDAFTLKEKVLKILRKDDNGFLKTILEKIKIKPKTNQQATKKNESSQSTNSSSQNEKSQRKPARETDIQNELKLLIQNRFYQEGLSITIFREAETDEGKKADFLISYGFVNPILIELKLSDHDDLKSEDSSKKIEETESYKQFFHYKNNFYCEYGILLILDNEKHKRDTWRSKLKKVRKAYEKNSNIEVISLSQRFKDSSE